MQHMNQMARRRGAGRTAAAWIGLGLSALLAACGGGGGGEAPAPQVSGITVDRVSYGRLSTFTVSGSNLASGVTFNATGCSGLSTVTASSGATQQVLTCTPTSAMNVVLTASAAGTTLSTLTRSVPKPRVKFATSLGDIEVELDPAKVAVTVDNFLTYVNSGFYNGTLIHRVVKDFVVQGGGFTGVASGTLTAQAGLRAPIVLETNKGLNNVRGTIAMARTSIADSATSQFFINTRDNPALDFASTASPGYAVFGTVVSGLGVVDTMNGVATQTVGTFANVPVTNVVVTAATQTQ